MKIDLTNYEAYFLDYIEKRLSPSEQGELEEFLLQNPNLHEFLTETTLPSLNPENITYITKDNLYKLEFEKAPVTSNNFSDYCIAWYENILTKEKIIEFQTFLTKHPNLRKEFLEFEKPFLTPEYHLQFPNKSQLLYHRKNNVKKIAPYLIWSSIAASIVLILSINLKSIRNNLSEIHANSATINKKENNIVFVSQKPQPKNSFNIPIKRASQKKKNRQEKIANLQIAQNTEVRETNIQPIEAITNKDLLSENKRIVIEESKFLAQNMLQKQVIETNDSLNTNEEEMQEATLKKGLLAFAESGIDRLNKITGQKIELSRNTNKLNNVTTTSIKTGFFEYYHKHYK
jgi:hypothetical protein